MKRHSSWFNPEASRVIETLDSGREICLDSAYIGFFTTGKPEDPVEFNETGGKQSTKNSKIWKAMIQKKKYSRQQKVCET